MSNKRAVETLGMSHGAACNRLRKMVLFRQLIKHNENLCVRCNEPIETLDELSIEHIKPWEGRSAELFWDLENVAFSHMTCNQADRASRAAEINAKKRKVGPEGTSWCRNCGFKPVSEFARSSNWSGFDRECKLCKNERNTLRDRKQVSKPEAPDGRATLS